MLRPLVSAWQSAPARCGPGTLGRQTQGPAVKVRAGQMPFLLFAKGVEVEIAFAFFSILESE